MKVIIAGSRSITEYREVVRVIAEAGMDITEVVSGTCNGPDKLGEQWAEEHNVPVKRFPAQWETHKRRAGFIRNSIMAKYADGLIALWDGQSHGTSHMIDVAQKAGLTVYVKHIGV